MIPIVNNTGAVIPAHSNLYAAGGPTRTEFSNVDERELLAGFAMLEMSGEAITIALEWASSQNGQEIGIQQARLALARVL